MTDRKPEDNSSSTTHEPWKKPGQTSQDPANHPPHDKDVLEQKKNQKQDK